LENSEEFAEFIRKHNPSAEALAIVQNEIQAEIKHGLLMIQKATNIAIQKVKDDAKADSKVEPTQAKRRGQSKGAARSSQVKRSLRNSAIKEGKSNPVERRQSDRKRNLEKNDVNNLLSQELEEKAIVSAVKAIETTSTRVFDDNIPEGIVRVHVFSVAGMESPHAFDVFEVKPKSKGATKKCKVGRSAGDDFKKFGISLPKDLEISQKHGVLTSIKKDNTFEFFFEDQGSSNGTFDDAEGVHLEKFVPYKLKNGMQLRMGQSYLQFNFSS
jgi:FHA domain